MFVLFRSDIEFFKECVENQNSCYTDGETGKGDDQPTQVRLPVTYNTYTNHRLVTPRYHTYTYTGIADTIAIVQVNV